MNIITKLSFPERSTARPTYVRDRLFMPTLHFPAIQNYLSASPLSAPQVTDCCSIQIFQCKKTLIMYKMCLGSGKPTAMEMQSKQENLEFEIRISQRLVSGKRFRPLGYF